MMKQQTLSVEDMCRKLKPVLGSKIDNIYLRYTMTDSREEKQEIESIIQALYHKKLNELLSKDVLLEPPKAHEVDGKFKIGKVSYANNQLHDFSLREEDFPRHICISGMSGSGKTTMAFNIIEELMKNEKPFLIFDWKKSFRPLMEKDPEVTVFPIGNEVVGNYFKTNINHPPKNVAPKEWISTITDLIAESFSVSFGVHKIIMEALDHAYEVNGVYDGSENYPTWKQIRDYLDHKTEKARGRESQWIESALRIATVLTFGSFGKIVNAKKSKGIEIEDLLNKKVIFELNALGNIEKKFFCEFILTYIFKMKKAYDSSESKSFDHAILVDEAHNIFLKDRPNFLKESVTDMIYREMREYGTSLICLDQHISKLSDTVKGNSACHIAFQQQLPQDIVDISDLMSLRQTKEIFTQLPVGTAIVKLSDRYRTPFLVEVPNNDLRKESITDMEVSERLQVVMTGKVPEKKTLVDEVLEMPNEDFEEEPIQSLVVNVVQEPIAISDTSVSRTDSTIPVNKLSEAQNILLDYVRKKMAQGAELKQINAIMEDHPDRVNYTNVDVSKVINAALDIRMSRINGKQTINSTEIVEVPKADIQPNLTKEEVKAELTKRRTQAKGKETQTIVESSDSKLANPSTQEPIAISDTSVSRTDSTLPVDMIAKLGDLTKEQESFLRYLEKNPTHDLSTVALYKEVGLSARKGNVVKNQLLERKLVKVQEEKNDKGWKKLIRLNLNGKSYSKPTSKPTANQANNLVESSDSSIPEGAERPMIFPEKNIENNIHNTSPKQTSEKQNAISN
jgi:hypothetical protein